MFPNIGKAIADYSQQRFAAGRLFNFKIAMVLAP